MSADIINLKKVREEKEENSKIVNLSDYRKNGMSEEAFKRKYMKNSIKSRYGSNGEQVIKMFLNKHPEDNEKN